MSVMQTQEVKIVRDPCGSDVLFFHVNSRLSMDWKNKPASVRSEKTRKLLENLLAINGVQDVSVNRYKVRIEKSRAFDWEVIVAPVEKAIINAVNEAGGNLE